MGDFYPAIESFPTTMNRHGLKVFIKTLMIPGSTKNVYLAHGFSDVHDTAHMRALTGAFVEAGYNVIVWDATHSWGRSEGTTEQASFYYHHEDLEDVIEWSRAQPWYQPQFALAGHSLGGMAAGTYAASHAATIQRLVLVSPVVSGPALRRRIPLPLRAWWRIRGHVRLPKGVSSYKWEFMRSSWSYNLLASAHRLTMPVLIIGAGHDFLIPPRLLKRLFRQIPVEQKRLEFVSMARHSFDGPNETTALRQAVIKWLTSP